MHTPTHAALNVLVLGRGSAAPRGLIAFAAIVPDLPMFFFFALQVWVFGEDPWGRIWRDIYFRPGWQHLFDAFHSIPLFLALGAYFTWRGSRNGRLVAGSLLLHSLVDWPTHVEDAHAYFWPLWREPLPGVISYWHPDSPVWVLELAIVVGALVWLVRERIAGRRLAASLPGCLLLVTVLAGAAHAAADSPRVREPADLSWRPSEGLDRIGTPAPEWTGIEWMQGGPLSLGKLRGKVVLLRFWLTDCPYCTRTAPALNALHEKYGPRGLVVVGLHHPKSAYTRQRDVVRAAARDLEFRFPVGTDDDWKTLDRYWTGVPGRSFTSVTFLIDRSGVIRFLHDGGAFFAGPGEEGRAYEAIETMITRLLAER